MKVDNVCYLGIDVGSVSLKYALVDDDFKVVSYDYMRTNGDIIGCLKRCLKKFSSRKVKGIAVTGSARKFVAGLMGADIHIDEITAHRVAVLKLYPKVKTIFEIGGQDSKIINVSDSNINFEMNNVCAAGTGSFLDQQAARLGMSIEEFVEVGKSTDVSCDIASRCTVFAESDMIHAQQSGIPIAQIVRGVHSGMVRNYFGQLCSGKKLMGQFLFEGGTSQNGLLVEEFAKQLLKKKLIKNKSELIVPKPFNTVLGAIGAAVVCKNKDVCDIREVPKISKFEFVRSEECRACFRECGAKISVIKVNDKELTLGKVCVE